MELTAIRPGTPEADDAARKILTALYETAALAQGGPRPHLTVERRREETKSPRSGELRGL